MTDQCWVALGGNEGDVPATMASAIERLMQRLGGRNWRVSRWYRSVAMGADAGADFWNGVAGFELEISPLDLLSELHAVEAELGRRRSLHWGPRPLDLDLLYVGTQQCQTPELHLPHRGRCYRRFVLDPLCELAADWIDPAYQIPVSQLQARLIDPQIWLPTSWTTAQVAEFDTECQRRGLTWPRARRPAEQTPSTGLIFTADVGELPAGVPQVPLPDHNHPSNPFAFMLAACTAAFHAPMPQSPHALC